MQFQMTLIGMGRRIRAMVDRESAFFLSVFRLYGKPYLIIFVLNLLIIAPILLADVFYVDDLGRHVTGSGGWSASSRYLSDILAPLIHTDAFLADASPLPQVIAAAEIALAELIILRRVTNKTHFSVWQYLFVVIAAVPFFLECMSYKYDAPYMAASVLFSFLPFLFLYKSLFVQLLSVFLCTLGMCLTYQASSGILPVMTVFLCYCGWVTHERLGLLPLDAFRGAKLVIAYAGAYMLAMLIYQKLLVVEVASYASSSLPAISELLPTIGENIHHYASLVLEDFRTLWICMIAIMLIGFIVLSMFEYGKGCIKAGLAAVLFLCFGAIASFGAYLLLEKPIFFPRSMYGFSFFLALVCLFVTSARKGAPFKLLSAVLAWVLFVFPFVYSNALQQQSQWTDFRTEMVIADLNDLDLLDDDPPKEVQLKGSIGLAPSLDQYMRKYPLLQHLVRVTFIGDTWTGSRKISTDFGFAFTVAPSSSESDWSDLPIVKETSYYTIRADEGRIRIELFERPV